jgi:hypothetical protein
MTNGSWSQVSWADSKIIALTTQVENLQDKLSKTSPGKGKPSGKGKPATKVTHNKKDKEPGNKWCYTKVGGTPTNQKTGAKVKWCPHHGTSAHMPFDHNHDKWLGNKKTQNAKYVEEKVNKQVKFSLDGTSKNVNTKTTADKDDKHPSKLQLSTSLCQSLVTNCAMMLTEANSVLDKVFDRAMDSN